MPNFPNTPAPTTKKNFSASYIDRTGELGTISLSIPDTVTQPELNTLASAIGAVTNAGLVSHTNTTKLAIKPTLAETLDENESSVSTKAELVFVDNALNTRSVSIPAPDAQFFDTDGKTVKNAGDMATAITNIALVLNGGATGTGTYTFQRGYLVNRSRKTYKPNAKPLLAEPAALTKPGDDPAV